MRIACIVPPLHFPVNEYGHGYLPPLGLLSLAGPLIDEGHDVTLIDADAGHLQISEVIERRESIWRGDRLGRTFRLHGGQSQFSEPV